MYASRENQIVPDRASLSAAKRALLAKWARGEASEGSLDSAGRIPRRPHAGLAPLSFGQQRLWFLNQLEPSSPLYNVPIPLWLNGDLNPDALQKALDAIVERHEALRTRFAAKDADPVQLIDPPSPVPMRTLDLTGRPPAQLEVEAKRLLEEEARRPFDLSRDLMIRALLVRMGEREWAFLVVMYHIASDVWSWTVICKELSALYPALLSGRPASLSALPIQYADFATWQSKWWNKVVGEKHLAYWRKQLAHAPACLELPTDHPRPAVQTFRGAWEYLTLPRGLGERLKALSPREGVTLFMTLLAAFQILLRHYTGQDDVSVGSPVAGRDRVELERLVGLFVNTLVLRTSLAGNPSFRELLGRVREVVLEALAHQEVPLEKLVEDLQPERSASHSPLIQVMFVLQEALALSLQLPGFTARSVELDTGTSKFDLTLTVLDSGDALTCGMEYNTDLYERETIRRMLGHYQQLLEGIVAGPERRLSDLPLLIAGEQHQLLVEWNQTRTAYPLHKCVNQLFEEQVEKTPDAVAAVFNDQRLTFRELNTRADELACHLRTLGVGPEVLVGIFVERSLDLIVSVLSVLKAGGAYLPLDLRHPKERLAHMLSDARPVVILTQRKWLAALPLHEAQVVCLDRNGSLGIRSVGGLPAACPDHLAYAIYTSGSTGRPKVVGIPHRAVVNFLYSVRECPGLRAGDVLLAVTPLSFDIAALELFLPLIVGGCVVIASEEAAADATALASIISRARVTVMQATPATWRLLVESGWSGQPGLKVLCGGEALSRGLANDLLKRCGSLWNLYGPTETTIWSTVSKVERGPGSVSIGRPIANTRRFILDQCLQPVPIGVPGELYLGGVGLARGYLHREELTAERFVPCPFNGEPGARLYRTGDRARYLPDGNIEFLGRLDHQVKIRGFRVELGEIEAVLSQHPAVRHAAVTLREDTPGDQRLVAFFVAHLDRRVAAGDLRRFLETKLPAYSVPSAFVSLEVLPLSTSGKVDRRALPVPDIARSELDQESAGPRTPIEERLAAIWCSVLRVQKVGLHDNFFELGGHSLLVTQLITRMRQSFRVEVPLPRVFQAPTVAGMAEVIEELLVVEIGHVTEEAARHIASPTG